jgi:allantoate deiminase
MSALGARIHARLDMLAAISAEPDRLTRVFLSPEQARANALVSSWMTEAGMTARIDAIGNVIGRYDGIRPDSPVLLLGSHLDTVRNAGRYDGMLGVVTAIACVESLNARGLRLPFAIEVVGFSDEEGTRFGATLLGSRALAGRFDPAVLDMTDDAGISMRQALRDFGLDPDLIPTAARRRDEILAYLELHIEQGPVLEREGLAVGRVTSISGASRLKVTVKGEAGHAGTVPMGARRDALVTAAECLLAVERECSGSPGLVGTAGRIEAHPGAVNVIPGETVFTLDIRAPEDRVRHDAVARVQSQLTAIAARRGCTIRVESFHDSPAAPCAPWLMAQIDAAIAATGHPPFALASGAGHDGLAIQAIADIGMIFVRCERGISHNPAEAITVADAEAGAQVLLHLIENFQPQEPA